MEKQQQYRFVKGEKTRETLGSWWTSLNENRGDRARLRRAERPEDVLLTEPFFRFLKQMPEEWSDSKRILSSAMVAAALSHVKERQDRENFAAQLATSKKGGNKPRMSELRFQQLQKSRILDRTWI